MSRRSGLGRGLGALIPQGDKSEDTDLGPFRSVPIGDLRVNPLQPRHNLDSGALGPLASSIAELGVLQPILVRSSEDGSYEIIAGERRWRAAQQAGLTSVPVIVKSAEDVSSLEQALVENLHRQDLSPLDEAAAYRQLIDDFGFTHEVVGQRMGKSRTAVSNLLRLLNLPARIQRLVNDGKLTEGHVRPLLALQDEQFQVALAERAVREQLSVRAVEEVVQARSDLERPVARRRKTEPSPAVLEWQETLSDVLDTRVQVTTSGKRGKIVIEFADLADLERVAQSIRST